MSGFVQPQERQWLDVLLSLTLENLGILAPWICFQHGALNIG